MDEGNHPQMFRNKGQSPSAIRTFPKPSTLQERSSKMPKCLIKIMGSRYNGTFLVSIDDAVDNAIYKKMLEIETGLDSQPNASTPKRYLSSVFQCFAEQGKPTPVSKLVKETKKKISAKPADSYELNPLKQIISKTNLGSPLKTASVNASSGSKVNEENLFSDFFCMFKETLDRFSTVESGNAGNQKRGILESPDKQIEVTSDDTKRTAFIKFHADDVLVIQPPKLMSDGRNEVGIELKPKESTTREIGQAIRLTKDKVLIDGNGVLRINENAGKRRSIHMTIEENGKGNQAVKVSVDEKDDEDNSKVNANCDKSKLETNGDQNVLKVSKSANTVEVNLKTSTQSNKTDKNVQVCSRIRVPRKIRKMSGAADKQWEYDRAHGAGEGWSRRTKVHQASIRMPFQHQQLLKKSNCLTSTSFPTSSSQTTDESENYHHVANTNLFTSETSYPSNIFAYSAINSRADRLPYLVHSLVEPPQIGRSDSVGRKTNKIKRHSIFRLFESKQKAVDRTHAVEPPVEEPPKVISEDSKCFDSAEWNDPKSLKKRNDISALAFNNFERILETLCGPNILYHKPEHSCVDHDVQCSEEPLPLVYDQWSQTETNRVEATHGKLEDTINKRDMAVPAIVAFHTTDGCTQIDGDGNMGWFERGRVARRVPGDARDELDGVRYLGWQNGTARDDELFERALRECSPNVKMTRSVIIPSSTQFSTELRKNWCGGGNADSYLCRGSRVKMSLVQSMPVDNYHPYHNGRVLNSPKFHPPGLIKSKSFHHFTKVAESYNISAQRRNVPPKKSRYPQTKPRIPEALSARAANEEQHCDENWHANGHYQGLNSFMMNISSRESVNQLPLPHGNYQYNFVVAPTKRSSIQEKLSSLKTIISRKLSGLFGKSSKFDKTSKFKSGKENIMFVAVPLGKKKSMVQYLNKGIKNIV